MHSSPSLVELEHAWANHPAGRHRAVGGRRALDGFRYQLALSLERFFDHLEHGRGAIETAFEGLGDLAQRRGDLVYLVQVKTTLRRTSLRHAVDEILAIDGFLENQFPDLRPQVRFAIWCRRRQTQDEAHASDAAALGLTGDDARRWRQVAPRVDPIEVRADPFLALVVRFFNRTSHAFLTFEALLGRLLRLLSDGDDSRRIGSELLELWSQQQRVETRPPGRLLAPRDFRAEDSDDDLILVGDRPFLEDLRLGRFMARPGRLRQVLDAIDGALVACRNIRRRRLPVVWIDGAPGVGKSVLLLQVLEELVNGRQWVVHRLNPSPDLLAEALQLWSHDDQPVVLAVDDIFAPNQRQAGAWQRVHQTIVDSRWQVLPLLLTCGPSDYRRAFEQEARREGTLHLDTVVIDGLDADERDDYGRWYGQRIGVVAPDVGETNFAAAAFLLDLTHRGERPDIGQFAERLAQRFRSQDLYDDMLVLLAADVLGIRLPPDAFVRRDDFLELLTREGILRTVGEPPTLRMMHPQMARSLYDELVPADNLRARADHLAQCFGRLRSHPALGDEFLERLDPRAGERGLDRQVRSQALAAIGQDLRCTAAEDLEVSHLRLWLAATRQDPPAVAGKLLRNIRRWLGDGYLGPSAWGQLWQVAWDLSPASEQRALARHALEWLQTYCEFDEWNYIWQALWAQHSASTQDTLERLGLEWLQQEADQPGWSYVFQALFDHGNRHEALRSAALQGLRYSPISAVDPHLWRKIWRLHPDPWEFIDCLLYRLTGCRFPHLQTKGLSFLWQLVGELNGERTGERTDDPADDRADGTAAAYRRLAEYLGRHVDRPMWAHFMQHPEPQGLPWDTLRPAVVDWLTRYGDRAEWNYLWQSFLDRPGDGDWLALGRQWLHGHEDRPAWAFVWQELLRRSDQPADLLDLGERWLVGRRDNAAWPHVWQRLIDHRPDHEELRQAAGLWLREDPERPSWNYVWRHLLDLSADAPDSERQLVDEGMVWLEGHRAIVQWPYVWHRLTETATDTEQTFDWGRQWLQEHPRRPEWSLVWQRLTELRPDDDSLWEHGRKWLETRNDHGRWAFVWRRLVDRRRTPELLDLGRRWMTRRGGNAGWWKVFERLLDTDLEDGALFRSAQRWLRKHPRHDDWPQVWQALAIRLPQDPDLFESGRQWLHRQSDETSEVSFVRRRLRAMARLQR